MDENQNKGQNPKFSQMCLIKVAYSLKRLTPEDVSQKHIKVEKPKSPENHQYSQKFF